MTSSDTITPFWLRLREITRYPLQSAALTSLLVLTVGRLVVYLPFGGLLNLLLWFAAYKYAVAVLRRTADGRLDAPEVSWEDESAGRLQIGLQIMFVLMAVLGFAIFGVIGGSLVAFALGLAMPGATMSLAMDGDFWNALNPLNWFAIATRIGWPYVAVAVLCIVIGVSQANAKAMLSFLPPVLDVLVFYFLAQYALLVAFHLMGYLIYQYHEQLGHEIEAPLQRRTGSSDPDQGLLDEAEHLVREGNALEAEQLLGNQIRRLGGSASVHGQYRKLLRLRGDSAALSQHGRDYIGVLMAQEQEKPALELARECLALDSGFAIANPDHVGRLAQRAAGTGQARLAVSLLSDFHIRHPKHADLPPNTLLAARLMADKMGQDREARALLSSTHNAFRDHPLRVEMEAYLAFLDSLNQPVART
jgi:hypothetical protein